MRHAVFEHDDSANRTSPWPTDRQNSLWQDRRQGSALPFWRSLDQRIGASYVAVWSVSRSKVEWVALEAGVRLLSRALHLVALLKCASGSIIGKAGAAVWGRFSVIVIVITNQDSTSSVSPQKEVPGLESSVLGGQAPNSASQTLERWPAFIGPPGTHP
jgi:hypothetical protein